MKTQEDIIFPSQYLEELMQSFHEDTKKVTTVLDQINSKSSNKIKQYIALAATSYSVIVEPVLFEEVERTCSMVCGPSFTSEKFPRPIDSVGNLMFPILQLNFTWINKVCQRTYDSGLLQLWWSAAKSEHELRFIPADQITIHKVTRIEITREMISAVQDWGIPDEWMQDEMNSAFVMRQCLPIGITYPEFDEIREELLENNEIDEETEATLYKMSSGYNYSSPVRGALFELFGAFTSPFDPLGFGESIFSTVKWCGGMMTANIYCHRNLQTGKQSFDFDWGR